MTTDSAYDQHIFWCVRAKRRVAGWVGLLGVAGIMKLIVSQWIIPENSLRKMHQSEQFLLFEKAH